MEYIMSTSLFKGFVAGRTAVLLSSILGVFADNSEKVFYFLFHNSEFRYDLQFSNGSIQATGNNLTSTTTGGVTTITGGTVTQFAFLDDDGNVVMQLSDFGGVSAVAAANALSSDNSSTRYDFLIGLVNDATTVTGSDGNDGAAVGAGNDTANTGAGDDLVVKSDSGNLTYNGGTGSDWLSFSPELSAFPKSFTQQLIVDLGTGVGQNPFGGTLALTSVENIVGTSEADLITGNNADNVIGDGIVESANGDVIDTLGGNDTVKFSSLAGFFPAMPGADIDGGTGTDTLFFQYDRTGNVLDLANQALNAGMFRASVFSNFERFVVGSDFATSFGDLVFRGDGSANYLSVLQGQLTIDLRGGDDTLVFAAAVTSDPVAANGGAGTDRLQFAGHTAGTGANILDLVTPANNSGSFVNVSLAGFEIFELLPVTTFFPKSLDFRGDGLANTAIGAQYNDVLAGNGGDDTLEGRAGHDRLAGGAGDDTMIGGLGNDTFGADSAGDVLIEAVNQGIETVETTLASFSLFALAHIERILYTGAGSFVGRGNGLDNRIQGAAGNDRFVVDQGGADRYFGETGVADTVDYRLSATGAIVNLTTGVHGGAAAGDFFSSIEYFFGSNTAADNFTGAGFNDRLDGYGGADTLSGLGGNDTLMGGDGDDEIAGGALLDFLHGNAGADDFNYADVSDSGASSGARDRIYDFAAGVDDLDVSAIDADTSTGGDDAFTQFLGAGAFTAAGQVRWFQSGANTVIEFNTTGASGAEMQIQLQGFTAINLTAGDFIA
jgi:hypothetical protein